MKDYPSTHERVLSAAERLFALQGYDATGVAEICAEAGLSKGAFYHHFPTKQAVFLEILEGWLRSLDAALQAARASAEDVPTALRIMAQAVAGGMQDSGARLPMLLEFWGQAQHEPAVWQAAIAPFRRYQRYFTDLANQGIQEGSLQPAEPQQVARSLLALALGLLMLAMFDPKAEAWGDVFCQTIEVQLESIQRRVA